MTSATCNTILYFGTLPLWHFFLEEDIDGFLDSYKAARLAGFYYSVTRYASINYIPTSHPFLTRSYPSNEIIGHFQFHVKQYTLRTTSPQTIKLTHNTTYPPDNVINPFPLPYHDPQSLQQTSLVPTPETVEHVSSEQAFNTEFHTQTQLVSAHATLRHDSGHVTLQSTS